MDTSMLLLGLLCSCMGSGYAWYGWKQRAAVPLLCGVLLMIVPWFVASAVVLVLLGGALCVIPWVLRR